MHRHTKRITLMCSNIFGFDLFAFFFSILFLFQATEFILLLLLLLLLRYSYTAAAAASPQPPIALATFTSQIMGKVEKVKILQFPAQTHNQNRHTRFVIQKIFNSFYGFSKSVIASLPDNFHNFFVEINEQRPIYVFDSFRFVYISLIHIFFCVHGCKSEWRKR